MKLIPTILFISLLTGSALTIDAQGKKEMFRFEALDFFTTEGTRSRVDLYVEIPLENFEFKRSHDDKTKFVSNFDLTIDVYDQSSTRVYDNVSKEALTTAETSNEYLAQNSQIIAKNLFLNPGKYKITLTVYEPSTQKRNEQSKDIEVLDFVKDPFSLSSIMIVSKLTEASGKKFITPSVSHEVGSLDTFSLFFYVYKNNTDQPVNVLCRVLDESSVEVFKWSFGVDPFANMQNQMIVPVPTTGFNYGNYSVEVTAENPSFKTDSKAHFTVQSSDFPFAMKDIDVLINQLQYIARDDEMNFMKDGKTKSDKEKRFIDFWKSKDPTPGTKRNEVMIEYYKRLFYADKHYGTTYIPGWRTDMGMVYIIFGSPSNVDRHPYDMDAKPYEVWDYYDLNKQFVFVDNTGFGDYRLITPIWETFRYQRN